MSSIYVQGSYFMKMYFFVRGNLFLFVSSYILCNGNFVTEQLHGTTWLCLNPLNAEIIPAEAELYVNVPISAIHISAVPTDSNPVDINNGSSQQFICTTDVGRPSSRIQWYLSDTNVTSKATVQPDTCSTDCKDGKVISSSVLEYNGNENDEGKHLFCTAANTNEMNVVRSQNRSIIIRYGPQKVVLSPEATTYTVNETDSFGPIACTADCKPNCTMVWSGPNLASDIGSDLILKNINRNQTGDYRCIASNIVGTKTSVPVYVTIKYGPKFVVTSPATLSYMVNETSNLGPISCTADCKPGCTITWTGPDLPMDTESVLNLQNISRSQAGEYQCRAENFLNEILSSAVVIAVYYGPQEVLLSPPTTTYTMNETDGIGPISCTADCYPNCTTVWSGRNLPNGIKSVLNIKNIDRNQAGDYRCTASNIVGTKRSVSVNVNINYGPRHAIVSPSILLYTINETSNIGPISCTADCKPRCQITWDGPNHSTGSHSVLILENISRGQAGEYQCRAENFYGNVFSSTIVIVVQFAPLLNPAVARLPNIIALKKEKPLNITINIISRPIPLVMWTLQRFGTNIQEDIDANNTFGVYEHSTKIYKPEVDFGYYVMTSSNILGSISINFTVILADKPSNPESVFIYCASTSAVFVWKSLSDGGLEQFFYIQYWNVKQKSPLNTTAISDQGENSYMNFTLYNLSPGIPYNFVVVSKNEIGVALSGTLGCTTGLSSNYEACPSDNQTFFKTGIATLVIGILILMCTIAALVVYRFRFSNRDKGSRSSEYTEVTSDNPVFTEAYESVEQTSNTGKETRNQTAISSETYEELQSKTPSDLHVYQSLQERGKVNNEKKTSNYANMIF